MAPHSLRRSFLRRSFLSIVVLSFPSSFVPFHCRSFLCFAVPQVFSFRTRLLSSAFVRSFVRSFVRWFVRCFVRCFVRPSVRSSVRPFVGMAMVTLAGRIHRCPSSTEAFECVCDSLPDVVHCQSHSLPLSFVATVGAVIPLLLVSFVCHHWSLLSSVPLLLSFVRCLFVVVRRCSMHFLVCRRCNC